MIEANGSRLIGDRGYGSCLIRGRSELGRLVLVDQSLIGAMDWSYGSELWIGAFDRSCGSKLWIGAYDQSCGSVLVIEMIWINACD